MLKIWDVDSSRTRTPHSTQVYGVNYTTLVKGDQSLTKINKMIFFPFYFNKKQYYYFFKFIIIYYFSKNIIIHNLFSKLLFEQHNIKNDETFSYIIHKKLVSLLSNIPYSFRLKIVHTTIFLYELFI